MPEMTTEQKLIQSAQEHCSPQALLRLLRHDEAEAIERLKKSNDDRQLARTQGNLQVIDRYIAILNKVVS